MWVYPLVCCCTMTHLPEEAVLDSGLIPSSTGSWGEKILASPQGEVLMYRWNCTVSFSRKPPRSDF